MPQQADQLQLEPLQTESDVLPQQIRLAQNYPNPFNPSTQIRFALPEASDVQLEVFNMLGQRVAMLASGQYPAGWHTVSLDAGDWSSGVYLYRLRAGSQLSQRQMILVK